MSADDAAILTNLVAIQTLKPVTRLVLKLKALARERLTMGHNASGSIALMEQQKNPRLRLATEHVLTS